MRPRGNLTAVWPFPRSSERGPIEGPVGYTPQKLCCHFRAHLSAAPLKGHRACCGGACRVYFRAHLSAAPLKGHRACCGGACRVYFRAHLSAAPLKGGRVRRWPAPCPNFRAHLSAAPLKEIKFSCAGDREACISALI